ncbi:MAG: hypothetical protein IPH18_18280 [Chitinophagaceae bacterium]|nr:hypothetical protein [Chitinophagaceae bacterium]
MLFAKDVFENDMINGQSSSASPRLRLMREGKVHIEIVMNDLLVICMRGYIAKGFVLGNVHTELFTMIILDSGFEAAFKTLFDVAFFIYFLNKLVIIITYPEV